MKDIMLKGLEVTIRRMSFISNIFEIIQIKFFVSVNNKHK